MMSVLSLPYLLNSLASANVASCVQPRSIGTVHHYPSHCNSNSNSSSTVNIARMGYQCAAETDARYGAAVQVKKEIKTDEGCQAHYSTGPLDTYGRHIRYTVDYQAQNHKLRSRPLPFALKTDMSLDIDSLFSQGPSPLSPLAVPSGSPPGSYCITDFSSVYDFPPQTSPDDTSFGMFSGGCGDAGSPVLTKMDSSGELLSLEELSNSELTYDDLCSSGVTNSLDEDWLIQPVSLPSPEEQDGDVRSFSPAPPLPPQSLSLTFQYCSAPISSTSPTILTPDPSLPASPQSIHSYSSEEEEIKDVLAFFDDRGSSLDMTTAVQPFAPSQMLSSVSSPQILDVNSPSPSSCLMIPSPPSPQDSDSCDSIRDLLSRSEVSVCSPISVPQMSAHVVSGSTDGSRKRKSLPLSNSDRSSCAPPPAVKRRTSNVSKKDRKKEQNKTAALRYRQKKKEEKSDIEERRAQLEDKNQQLKAQVNSLSNEINYLKKLWSEVSENKKRCQMSKLC